MRPTKFSKLNRWLALDHTTIGYAPTHFHNHIPENQNFRSFIEKECDID